MGVRSFGCPAGLHGGTQLANVPRFSSSSLGGPGSNRCVCVSVCVRAGGMLKPIHRLFLVELTAVLKSSTEAGSSRESVLSER